MQTWLIPASAVAYTPWKSAWDIPGYSADAEDAFIFYGITTGKIDTGKYVFEPSPASIQTLNDRASRGELALTCLTAHAYAYVRDRYVLARSGGRFCETAGPIIVSREPMAEADLPSARLAVSGTTTSAYLLLRMHQPTMRTQLLPADKMLPALQTGVVDCALVTHKLQLTGAHLGLHCVMDLGKWWTGRTKLPLPVAVVAIRKDLPAQTRSELADMVAKSVRYALDHRAEAMRHALRQAGRADAQAAEECISACVNDATVDMGARGIEAIEELLRGGHKAQFTPDALPLEFA